MEINILYVFTFQAIIQPFVCHHYSIGSEQISASVHDETSYAVLAGTYVCSIFLAKLMCAFLGKNLWDSDEWESIVYTAHRLQNAVKDAVDKQSM